MLFIEYPKCTTCKKEKGMLVKRPLLITEDKILVGFKEAEWESIL